MIDSREQQKEAEAAYLESKNYLADAVRFNVFSLEKQQQQKGLALHIIIFLANLVAVMFDSLLHVNLGRDYVRPFDFALKLLGSLFYIVQAFWFLIFLLLLLWVARFAGWFNLFDPLIDYGLAFFRSSWVWLFFTVGAAAMILQAIHAYLSFNKDKTFSYSNGTPWLFHITHLPFFKGSKYVFFLEPLIIIASAAMFYFAGFIVSEISNPFEDAIFIVFLGMVYLARNMYVHDLIEQEIVKRNNMEIQGIFEKLMQPEKMGFTSTENVKKASEDDFDNFAD